MSMIENSSEKGGGGLYIHVPYCHGKCLYCDFYSGGCVTADWQGYLDAVGNELRLRGNELGKAHEDGKRHIDTLYIGGGTPSLMPKSYFRRLIDEIRDIVTISKSVGEFTFEANPEDIDLSKVKSWKEGGVNRLSLGIQTFSDNELSIIGRRHDANRSRSALEMASDSFDNISIDLMFGLPGQTLHSWESTIKEALHWHPQHISAYMLMYEEKTALTLLRDQGKIVETDDDILVKMYEMLTEMLSGDGYDHYEISNYSLPGYRSQHNSSYWNGKKYLGLGPSAHSYDGKNIRRWNPSDLKGYIANYADNKASLMFQEEILSQEELREEMILTRLRTKEGIDIRQYSNLFGEEAMIRLKKASIPFMERGLMETDGYHIHLSNRGVLISDEIIVALV